MERANVATSKEKFFSFFSGFSKFQSRIRILLQFQLISPFLAFLIQSMYSLRLHSSTQGFSFNSSFSFETS
ncbi:hypothetical protein BT69DRAFT_1285897 [Atractiella rhizophila]|nr:hypothetical protein BT69DRAFT_1285897 [Atractiella rhizophila]